MPGKIVAPARMDRLVRERVHDPYGARLAPQGPAAYRRIRGAFPAGVVTVSGGFALEHKDEVVQIARHQETLEKRFRPLHRIMGFEATAAGLAIKTTDIHLPRRIGEALHRAYKGRLEVRYEPETYFIRVNWRRD